MITIQELLYNRGLDKNAKVKLVKHSDPNNINLFSLYKTNKESFLDYQSSQSTNVFKNTDYIVTFVSEKGTLLRFIGVFQVINWTETEIKGSEFKYQIIELNGFQDLKERVIIEWGKSRGWHHGIEVEKKIVEIHPGLHYKQFTDYFDFILNFDELKEIVTKQYSDWKKMLSVTKGIYLISDTKTGKLYVGSAYGEDGIWGRWKSYVSTNGHGNNKTLKELVENNLNYGNNFQFSILMLLPRTITADEAIKKEHLFKNKLGARTFGLNNN